MGTDSQSLTMLEKVDGIRKVLAGVIILAVGVVIAVVKNDIPANLLQLLEVLFGGFIVGNVGEHIVGAVHARAQAGVDVAKITAEANEPEPWDDEFEQVNTGLVKLAEATKLMLDGTQRHLTDIHGALRALVEAPIPEAPKVDLAPVAAELAEVKGLLVQATTPKEDAPDYAAAITTIVQTLDTVRKSQEITNKAISILISKT